LEKLQEANPDKKILNIQDPEFATYGTVHPHIQVPKMREYVYGKDMMPEEVYVACEEDLMQMDESVYFTQFAYGETACQIGYYTGFGTTLNALEYHKCSEVLVEFEPVVLILGHIWDIRDGKVDTSDLKLFYVPAGTCVELYATTLHFAPCMATPAGVRQVVCQTATTNTDLHHPELMTDEGENKFLYQRNKWVLIHPEAAASFEANAVQGITGENLAVVPVQE
jgi:hypothetical protein